MQVATRAELFTQCFYTVATVLMPRQRYFVQNVSPGLEGHQMFSYAIVERRDLKVPQGKYESNSKAANQRDDDLSVPEAALQRR